MTATAELKYFRVLRGLHVTENLNPQTGQAILAKQGEVVASTKNLNKRNVRGLPPKFEEVTEQDFLSAKKKKPVEKPQIQEEVPEGVDNDYYDTLVSMNKSELVKVAEESDVDIRGLNKKEDIIAAIMDKVSKS